MKKAVWSGIIAAAGVLALSTSVYAQQTASGSVLVTANVNAKAKLTINGGATASITFADADPDVSIVNRQDGTTTVSPPSRHPRRVSKLGIAPTFALAEGTQTEW